MFFSLNGVLCMSFIECLVLIAVVFIVLVIGTVLGTRKVYEEHYLGYS